MQTVNTDLFTCRPLPPTVISIHPHCDFISVDPTQDVNQQWFDFVSERTAADFKQNDGPNTRKVVPPLHVTDYWKCFPLVLVCLCYRSRAPFDLPWSFFPSLKAQTHRLDLLQPRRQKDQGADKEAPGKLNL